MIRLSPGALHALVFGAVMLALGYHSRSAMGCRRGFSAGHASCQDASNYCSVRTYHGGDEGSFTLCYRKDREERGRDRSFEERHGRKPW
jgi:hypothetical protein